MSTSDPRADLEQALGALLRRPGYEPHTWTVPPGTCITLVGGVPCLRRKPCTDHDEEPEA